LQSEEHKKTRDYITKALENTGSGGGDMSFKSANAANTRFEMLSEEEVAQKILRSLHYASMQDRLDSVLAAHRNTFEWVFSPPSQSSHRWSNFVDWLRNEESVYWVNGKAGSGKSTLFRYLYYHTMTKHHLQAWAGNKPLNIEGFFFWNSGVADQRSQSGLLRSLCWQILSKHQAHIRNVFVDECEW